MASKVFLHIGLPKTATTYLQTILWGNREALADQGLLLPGEERHDHLWATRIVREDPQFRKANEHRQGAWQRILDDIAAWDGRAVVSHEFFAAASQAQAARVIADLAPAEVHLVVTAREPLGLFTASWQESIKNRDTRSMADYSTVETDDTGGVWNWRTLDVHRVLQRWSPDLPPAQVHVLPLPAQDAPRRTIWDRFAALVGADPDSVDLSQSFPNTSMGVAEAETLRRMNHHLGDFNSAIDRGTYIRTFLADERLVPRQGDRYWPSSDRVEEARERGKSAVAHIAEQGFDVIGDLDTLLVPDQLPERRTPESVTDAEVAEVAVELAARMLHDVRDLRHERRALRHEVERERHRADNPSLRLALVHRWPWLSRLLLRD
ncbi:hypothetical protein [Marmoricola sp. URHB0036]|uniref:hypothetical protein n=1 Tax=Marmoricola sp. URHB0036 TaxID=1298863 RepID=UPI00042684D4|nr:hypothetical protein [Marmoricola sp. URHB0036]